MQGTLWISPHCSTVLNLSHGREWDSGPLYQHASCPIVTKSCKSLCLSRHHGPREPSGEQVPKGTFWPVLEKEQFSG